MDNEFDEEWEELSEILKEKFNCNISVNNLKNNSNFIFDNFQKIYKLYEILINKDCKEEDFNYINNEIEKMKKQIHIS